MYGYITVLKNSETKGSRYPVVDKSEIIIGSGDECHIRVLRTNVAPKHCSIQISANSLPVLKNMSMTALPLNYRNVFSSQILKPFDKFVVGDRTFMWESADKNSPSPAKKSQAVKPNFSRFSLPGSRFLSWMKSDNQPRSSTTNVVLTKTPKKIESVSSAKKTTGIPLSLKSAKKTKTASKCASRESKRGKSGNEVWEKTEDSVVSRGPSLASANDSLHLSKSRKLSKTPSSKNQNWSSASLEDESFKSSLSFSNASTDKNTSVGKKSPAAVSVAKIILLRKSKGGRSLVNSSPSRKCSFTLTDDSPNKTPQQRITSTPKPDGSGKITKSSKRSSIAGKLLQSSISNLSNEVLQSLTRNVSSQLSFFDTDSSVSSSRSSKKTVSPLIRFSEAPKGSAIKASLDDVTLSPQPKSARSSVNKSVTNFSDLFSSPLPTSQVKVGKTPKSAKSTKRISKASRLSSGDSPMVTPKAAKTPTSAEHTRNSTKLLISPLKTPATAMVSITSKSARSNKTPKASTSNTPKATTSKTTKLSKGTITPMILKPISMYLSPNSTKQTKTSLRSPLKSIKKSAKKATLTPVIPVTPKVSRTSPKSKTPKPIKLSFSPKSTKLVKTPKSSKKSTTKAKLTPVISLTPEETNSPTLNQTPKLAKLSQRAKSHRTSKSVTPSVSSTRVVPVTPKELKTLKATATRKSTKNSQTPQSANSIKHTESPESLEKSVSKTSGSPKTPAHNATPESAMAIGTSESVARTQNLSRYVKKSVSLLVTSINHVPNSPKLSVSPEPENTAITPKSVMKSAARAKSTSIIPVNMKEAKASKSVLSRSVQNLEIPNSPTPANASKTVKKPSPLKAPKTPSSVQKSGTEKELNKTIFSSEIAHAKKSVTPVQLCKASSEYTKKSPIPDMTPVNSFAVVPAKSARSSKRSAQRANLFQTPESTKKLRSSPDPSSSKTKIVSAVFNGMSSRSNLSPEKSLKSPGYASVSSTKSRGQSYLEQLHLIDISSEADGSLNEASRSRPARSRKSSRTSKRQACVSLINLLDTTEVSSMQSKSKRSKSQSVLYISSETSKMARSSVASVTDLWNTLPTPKRKPKGNPKKQTSFSKTMEVSGIDEIFKTPIGKAPRTPRPQRDKSISSPSRIVASTPKVRLQQDSFDGSQETPIKSPRTPKVQFSDSSIQKTPGQKIPGTPRPTVVPPSSDDSSLESSRSSRRSRRAADSSRKSFSGSAALSLYAPELASSASPNSTFISISTASQDRNMTSTEDVFLDVSEKISALNDLSNLEQKEVPHSPSARRSKENKVHGKLPKNDLTNISGVKKALKLNSPKNDLTNISGVKKALKLNSPKNDLTNISGVKKALKLNSPKNDLINISGVKKALKLNSPKNDLTNISGVKKALKLNSPRNDLTRVSGLKKALKVNSPKNDLTNVPSLKQVFYVNKTTSPILDGMSRLFDEPTLIESDKAFDSLVGKSPLKTYAKKASVHSPPSEAGTSQSAELNKSVVNWLEESTRHTWRSRMPKDSKKEVHVGTTRVTRTTRRKKSETEVVEKSKTIRKGKAAAEEVDEPKTTKRGKAEADEKPEKLRATRRGRAQVEDEPSKTSVTTSTRRGKTQPEIAVAEVPKATRQRKTAKETVKVVEDTESRTRRRKVNFEDAGFGAEDAPEVAEAAEKKLTRRGKVAAAAKQIENPNAVPTSKRAAATMKKSPEAKPKTTRRTRAQSDEEHQEVEQPRKRIARGRKSSDEAAKPASPEMPKRATRNRGAKAMSGKAVEVEAAPLPAKRAATIRTRSKRQEATAAVVEANTVTTRRTRRK